MPDHQMFPPEIWLEVFRWATTDASCNLSITSEYVPFQPAPNIYTADPTATVKSALPLVCRQWKSLSIEFLYQDLRLLRGANALKSSFDQDKARWVRHAAFT